MKQRIFILLVLITFFGLSSQGQSFLGAAIVGVNLSQVDGDEVYGFHKPGLNIGASAIIPIRKTNWQIAIENTFTQKGAYSKYAPSPIDTLPYYNLRLTYLEVPVLLLYNDRDVITGGVGMSWGRLVRFKEIEHGKEIEWSPWWGPYKRDDWNIMADIRFRVVNKFHVNFRYAYSLAKIRTRTYTPANQSAFDRDQFNNLLTFRLIYIFNETVPDKDPKRKK